MNAIGYLPQIVRILLLLTALTPLITIDALYLFPFVFGKTLFYRSLVEGALFLTAFYLMAKIFLTKTNFGFPEISIPPLLKNPLTIFICLFFISATISTFLAPNSYRAFFGDLQRGEGFLGLIHYFVFLVLALTLFKKQDWLLFFKILLGVGIVSILYAWLQYLAIEKVPFALNPASQPGSFSGNPSFLGSFLILALGLAAVLFFNAENRSFWRYFSLLFSLLAVLTIFLTSVRGAVLGLAAGGVFLLIYLAFMGKGWSFMKINLRVLSFILLIALLSFSFIFWTTRNSPVWLKIPGLGRLTTVSLENPSVITRLIALGVSWEAFKERPIFGWGMENYSIAYNKHYNPAYSFYAEDWFDRAHNRVADIAVMQGSLGLIAYFGIFFGIFYLLWKARLREEVKGATSLDFSSAAPFLAAAIVAYFIQNLFLFDQITSYIPFFALAGAMIVSFQESKPAVIGLLPSKIYQFSSAVLAILVMGAMLYALYFYNYLPAYQAIALRDAIKLKVGDKILAASENFLKPYNFAQAEIRAKFVEIMYDSGLVSKKQFAPLVDKALNALEEVVGREPYEPRHYSRLIESYNERAKEDASLFKKTEVWARRAIELSPSRQGLIYHLSFIFSGQGRHEEAIELAQKTLELEKRSAKAHYELAIAYALAADSEVYKGTATQIKYREEAEAYLDKARELGRKRLGTSEEYTGSDLSNTQYYLFLESDLKNMVVLYRVWQRAEKMADVLEVLTSFHPQKKDYQYDAIVVYRALRDKQGVIRHAEELKWRYPDLAGEMDPIIDLANKGNWEILDTL